MRLLLVIAIAALTNGCMAAKKFFTPPPVVQWTDALTKLPLYCASTDEGIAVSVLDNEPCPAVSEVETIADTARRRTRQLDVSFRKLDVRIADFKMRCYDKKLTPNPSRRDREVVRGCTQGDVIIVYRREWKQSLNHEFGHHIVERAQLHLKPWVPVEPGDPQHFLCAFWMMLEGRECVSMKQLDSTRHTW